MQFEWRGNVAARSAESGGTRPPNGRPRNHRNGTKSRGRAQGKSPRFPLADRTASRLSIAIGSSLRFPLVMTNAANCPAAMSNDASGCTAEKSRGRVGLELLLSAIAMPRFPGKQHNGPLTEVRSLLPAARSRKRFAPQLPDSSPSQQMASPKRCLRRRSSSTAGRFYCICRDVKSAEALDGDYLTQSKVLRRHFDGIVSLGSPPPGSSRIRAAGRISSRHSAGRGNAGLPDPHIPLGIARTSRTPTSRCAAGRKVRSAGS